ncbi:MAG TPA: protease pro-enzyme activation domain-containing protein [Phenylobacterium sp.]|nr:protease pro-enzyme activation domain-containing protein [Phenylobacterium sp.]
MATTVLAAGGVANATPLTSTATPVPATQPVSFTVYLPLRNVSALKALLTAQQTVGSASYHKWLSPADVAAQFGPTPAAMAQAQATLTAAGLTVTGTHIRSIEVSGPAGSVSKLLLTALKTLPASDGSARVIASSRVVVPQSLAGAIIPTFSAVPEHKPLSVMTAAVPDNRNGPAGSYNYNDLKQAYDYPAYTSLDGTGAHVAIVMEANASNNDVAAMFTHESFTGTTGKAPPTYTYVPIDGGGSFHGVNDGGTDEAELDVQMVLGGAPGASVSLFSIPNLADSHIIHAYEAIIDSGAYDIVTSSFGECELFYTPAYNNGYDFTGTLGLYDEIFMLGNAEGITFLASSGDEGGTGCPSVNIVPHFVATFNGPPVTAGKGVSTPSGDPNVTSVGGGNLITSFTAIGALPSTYVSEQGFGDPEIAFDEFGVGVNVNGQFWGAGGGVGTIFARPAYQTLVDTGSTTFRTQPDIGMLVGGCPGGISVLPCGPNRSAVVVTIGAPAGSDGVGHRFGFIGTSVASPEFAGALALLVQALGGRVGNINPTLYALAATQIAAGGASAPAASQFYHMNIPGFDGVYSSAPPAGYNYIFGNGSPDIRNLFGLTAFPAAGTPRSATNP